MLKLGNGYPFEFVIFDPVSGTASKVFIDNETGLKIAGKLSNKDTRYIMIGGKSYFWSDIRSFGEVKLPKWLDHLLYKSGEITKKENQHKVLVEYTRLLKNGSTFHGEEQVFNFLSLTK